jgi:exodeoxyribonuclease VII large subunit
VADVRAATPTAAAALLAGARRDLIARTAELTRGLARALAAGLGNLRWRLEASRRALRDPRRAVGEYLQRLDDLTGRIDRLILKALRDARRGLEGQLSRLKAAGPDRRVALARRESDRLARDLERLMADQVKTARLRISGLNQRLAALSPVAVLSRGYAIVLDSGETRVIRRATEVTTGQSLRVRLGEGRLGVTVDEVN